MDQLANMNWGGPGYAEYQGYGKKSSQETHTFGLQQTLTQNLYQWATGAFKAQQTLLKNTIIPGLTQMATNPQGFGATSLAAMKSQLIGTVGEQLSSGEQQLQQNFASENLAGLGSGVEQGIAANLRQTAAGQEAGGLQNIDIANANLKAQQQQFGYSGLMGAEQELGQVPQSVGLLQQGLGQQFNMANVLNQQGTFWSNLAIAGATALGGPVAGQTASGEFGGGGVQGAGGMIPVIGGGGGMQTASAGGGGGMWGNLGSTIGQALTLAG